MVQSRLHDLEAIKRDHPLPEVIGRYVRLYTIKSFAGMDHVHGLVRRMMQATGVWAEWCNRKAE